MTMSKRLLTTDIYRRMSVAVVLVAITQTLAAQEVVDSVLYRFCYTSAIRRIENKKPRIDEHWLDIGRNGVSKYHSRAEYDRTQLADSVRRAGGTTQDILNAHHREQLPTPNMKYVCMKNCPAEGTQTVYWHGLESYKFADQSSPQWTLLDGDTIILGHACHKAEASYNGRKWTAWYAEDIAISDGPFRLCGLPGLVMSAYDRSGDVRFDCFAICTDVHDAITLPEGKYSTTTPEKLERAIVHLESDPLGSVTRYMDMKGVKANVRTASGAGTTGQASEKPVLIERYTEPYERE